MLDPEGLALGGEPLLQTLLHDLGDLRRLEGARVVALLQEVELNEGADGEWLRDPAGLEARERCGDGGIDALDERPAEIAAGHRRGVERGLGGQGAEGLAGQRPLAQLPGARLLAHANPPQADLGGDLRDLPREAFAQGSLLEPRIHDGVQCPPGRGAPQEIRQRGGELRHVRLLGDAEQRAQLG